MESPILRVSRPVSACARCKKTKIKCDGKLPVCTACEKHGRATECVSSSSEFARGKERSYMTSLESRIQSLERKLAQLDKQENNANAFTTKSTEDENKSSAQTINEVKKTKEGAHVEDLISDLGFITVNATSKGLYDFTKDMTFARLVLRASSMNEQYVPVGRESQLPARNIAMQLIQYYLNTIFSKHPFFDESVLILSVHSVYHSEKMAAPFNVFMVYMILGISTLAQCRDSGSPSRIVAQGYIISALKHMKEVIVPYSGMGVQALLLVLQYALLEPGTYKAWYLIGVISRITVDLGFHQDIYENGSAKSEVELRRRLFYSVYSYDRDIAITYEKPFSFSDESVNVKLPRVDNEITAGIKDGQSIPLNMAVEGFRFSVKNSKWYVDLRYSARPAPAIALNYIAEQRKDVQKWAEDLPETIDPSRRQCLKLDYYYIQLQLLIEMTKAKKTDHPIIISIVDTCIGYITTFQDVLFQPERVFFCTFAEAIRLHRVAQKLIETLCRTESQSMDPRRKQQTLLCMQGLQSLLEVLSKRWEEAQLFRESFLRDSKIVEHQLFPGQTTSHGKYVDPAESIKNDLANEWQSLDMSKVLQPR